MKYIVQLKCNLKDYDYLIKKIVQNKISVIDSKLKKDEYFFTIYDDDYEKLMFADYKKILKFMQYKGIYNIYNFIINNILYELVTLFIIVIIFLSNYLILKVNVHTSDVNLRQKILYYLMDNNINDFSFKKDFKSLSKIKKKIINKYHDDIEWLEIKSNGYIYNIYIIKRNNAKPLNETRKCHYIANKSGTITKIFANKGVLMVQENNYVSAGDILISGDIIYNEELKSEVCAKGKIYGEVWYEVDVLYPLKVEYIKDTKKRKYSISFNLFNKRFKLFQKKYEKVKTIKKIGNKNFGLTIIKSTKTKRKIVKISEETGTKKALEKALKSIEIKTHHKSNILSQNILKKYVNNGTIYMKVLITTEEELGVVESY